MTHFAETRVGEGSARPQSIHDLAIEIRLAEEVVEDQVDFFSFRQTEIEVVNFEFAAIRQTRILHEARRQVDRNR